MALNSISKGMSDYMRDGFDKAITRDMSFEMNDEEGMFHLFVYELIAEEAKHFIDFAVMEHILHESIETLFGGGDSPLRKVFEQEWA